MSKVQRIMGVLLLGLALVAGLGGCRQSNNAAVVNGQAIPRESFERQVQIAQVILEQEGAVVDWNSLSGQSRLAKLRQEVLDTMIDELLIAQALEEAGLAVDPVDLEEAVAEASRKLWEVGFAGLEDYLSQIGITMEEYEDQISHSLQRDLALEQLVPLPDKLAQVHVRHILLLTEEDTQEALERIEQGEDWTAVVENVSTDRISPGGDLGWLPLEALPASISQGIAHMNAGDVKIVSSEFGYHIIEMLERHEGAIHPDILDTPTLLRVIKQERFADWLDQRHQQAQIEQWVEED